MRRRFTLLDVMILVAATAVGIAAARGYLGAEGRACVWTNPSWDFYRVRIAAAAPCLTAWGLALLGLRLGTPRRRLRRLIWQPGFSACLAEMVGVASALLRSALPPYQMMTQDQQDIWILMLVVKLAPSVVPAIATTWLLILLGGRWRRRSDWIDGAGRMLGLAWFVMFLASQQRGVL